MKKMKYLPLGLVFFSVLTSCNGNTSQQTTKKSIGNIIVNGIRVQLLDENTIRFEKGIDGKYCDESTLFIPSRSHYQGVEYSQSFDSNNHYITFSDKKIVIPNNGEDLKGIEIYQGDKKIYTYKAGGNKGELPRPGETPSSFQVNDRPRVIVPNHGYQPHEGANILNDYVIQEKALDTYVILTNDDATTLRESFVNLTGRTEMMRLKGLGLWDSKYYRYTEKTAQEQIDKYAEHNLPIDNIVIDTDWRKSSGPGEGIGYEIDTSAFPDMKGFLDSVHEQNIEVMFNDHPEPAFGSRTLLDPKDVAYRHENLTRLLDMGVDYWWYDRNWTVALKTPINTINPETWGMYLYHDITEQAFKKHANDEKIYKRPVMMGNIDNIANGDYKGIKNTASHRYGFQWTGDIGASSFSLNQEVENIVKAGISGIPYASSDLGGHNGNPSNEIYTRWIQYGALSPIFRPHSSKYNDRYRQPWLYGNEALDISREYLNMRYRLMPLFYQLSHENYQKGLPLSRALDFNYQDDKNAMIDNQFLVGNDILFAPISSDIYETIPSEWFNGKVKAKYFDNEELFGDPIGEEEYDNIDFNWGNDAPLPGMLPDHFSASFEANLTPKVDCKLSVKVDDGVRIYVNGEKVLDRFVPNDSVIYESIDLKGNENYDIKIEYYEAAGGAYLNLLYKNDVHVFDKEVYLPEGKWMDVFSGKIYEGKQKYKIEYSLRSAPIFVRMGGTVPLLAHANNTNDLDWSKITFDYYPDKEATSSSYIYEDDENTTAYKYGKNRISEYKSYFDKDENCYVFILDKAKGDYEDEITSRNVSFRFHDVNHEVIKATHNGNLISMNYAARSESAFPFMHKGSSPDAETYSIDFTTSLDQLNVVKVYVK